MKARAGIISFLLSALLLPSVTDYAQQSRCIPVRSVREADLAFCGGERLSYVLKYRFGFINSDIGDAVVSLDTVNMGSEGAFHCRVYGKTRGFYDRLFHVEEDFNSYFTREGLTPLRFTRNTHEGRYRATNEYAYNWTEESPWLDAKVYTSRWGETRSFNIPLKTCTFDLPSLFFYARNMDLSRVEQDVKYPMTFAIDEEIFDVYFIYRGRETLKVKNIGNVKCLSFAAKLLEGGVFKGDSDMIIYVSDDENRIPVYFYAKILVGEVSGRLTGAEGLKNEFAALS